MIYSVGGNKGGIVMSELNLTLKGYRFRDEEEYNEAKKELEAIAYIRAKTNLDNVENVYKLYQKFNSKKTFRTMIGMEFMRELQSILLNSETIASDELEGIAVSSYEGTKITENTTSNSIDNTHMESVQVRYKNLKIVTGFLVAVIIIMLIIAVKSEGITTAQYEREIQDKYAAWAEELSLKEQELNEKEKLLGVDSE